MGTNLGPGTYTGATDNFSWATRDVAKQDSTYMEINCNKTLWYKFSTTVSGDIRYRIGGHQWTGVSNNYSYYYYLQLFKQVIPGDSSSNGLQIIELTHRVTYSDGTFIFSYWGQENVFPPGTYYIILPGCGDDQWICLPPGTTAC